MRLRHNLKQHLLKQMNRETETEDAKVEKKSREEKGVKLLSNILKRQIF